MDTPVKFNLIETMERIELKLIHNALHYANQNKTEAAKLLGINRTTLVEKLRRLYQKHSIKHKKWDTFHLQEILKTPGVKV